MRQLDHPNIIKLVDFSESKQYYYIILELAPGGELFHQIVRLTYFSEDLSRHVITQVAEALEYLHEEKGVVHRYASTARTLHLIEELTALQRYKARKLAFRPNTLRPNQEPQAKGSRRGRQGRRGRIHPGCRRWRYRTNQNRRFRSLEDRLGHPDNDALRNCRIHSTRNRQG